MTVAQSRAYMKKVPYTIYHQLKTGWQATSRHNSLYMAEQQALMDLQKHKSVHLYYRGEPLFEYGPKRNLLGQVVSWYARKALRG